MFDVDGNVLYVFPKSGEGELLTFHGSHPNHRIVGKDLFVNLKLRCQPLL